MTIYQVMLEARQANQQIITDFTYVSQGTPAAVSGSFALASAFGAIYDTLAVPPGYPSDTLLSQIAALISSQVSFVQLYVYDPYNPVDFYQTPFLVPYTGANGGETASPTVAFGFYTNRVRRDIRRGMRRLPGVTEANTLQNGGVDVSPGSPTRLTAAKMSAVLEYDDEGNTLSFAPVIASKQRYNPDTQLSDPDGSAYRWYPTEAEQLTHLATGIQWFPYEQTRTQRSRQFANGA